MNFLEAKQYINSFINYESKLDSIDSSVFKLDRILHLLDVLQNPQEHFRTIHVGGTNGKGSVCAYVASILKAQGYKTGLYTSPHLSSQRERIRILDSNETSDVHDSLGCISEEELCHILDEIKPKIELVRSNKRLGRITFFELFTALALYYFYRSKVDFAVLEVGLGGRLDATNAVRSSICGITKVSLEHTQQLGDTLTDVAKEKAAIIKGDQQHVVIAPQEKEAMDVITEQCQKYGIQPLIVGKDILTKKLKSDLSSQTFSLTGPKQSITATTQLLGEHQMINAAVALGIVESLEKLGFSIDESAVERGIEQTIWPGRFEVIQRDPLIILDGAHNPASARALADTINDCLPNKKVSMVFGVSMDKDIEGITQALKNVVDEVILTKTDHPRAADCYDAKWEKLFEGKKIIRSSNVAEALSLINKNNVTVVTGSLFIVGEARELCTSLQV